MCRPFLYAYEIKRMVTMDNIATAAKSRNQYKDKDGANNWAEWAFQNPELNRILNQVELELNG